MGVQDRVLKLYPVNPFASIRHNSTSKGKVKVRDICLNNSFLT